MWLKKLILIIWSYSPVLAFTDDANFLTADPTGTNHKYHFSIFNLLLGEHLFQFLSFPIRYPEDSFHFFRHIQMSKMETLNLLPETNTEQMNNYKTHCAGLSEDELQIEKEALLRKIEIEQNRQTISNSKINIFSAVMLVLLPLLLSNINWSVISCLHNFERVLIVFLIYTVINICAWILQSLKVRGQMVSTFSDLRESENKALEHNFQLFYDWQHMRRETQKQVSFVSYIYDWLLCAIILSSIFTAVHLTYKPASVSNAECQVYTFSANATSKTYDPSAVEWTSLILELQRDNYSKVIVLSNDINITPINEVLEKFTHQKIAWLIDPTLESDCVKVILED